jgi:hypothetical protein
MYRSITLKVANICAQVSTQDWYARRGYKVFQDEPSKWKKFMTALSGGSMLCTCRTSQAAALQRSRDVEERDLVRPY